MSFFLLDIVILMTMKKPAKRSPIALAILTMLYEAPMHPYRMQQLIKDTARMSFTHTIGMRWILPGVKPTGRHVEVPLVAIVGFRDDKLAHENIYWDQASVLKQIGLLPDVPLSAYGSETARKVLDLQV